VSRRREAAAQFVDQGTTLRAVRRLSLAGLIGAVLAVAVAGCGSSSSSSSSSTAASSGTTSTTPSAGSHVVMKNLAFAPRKINAKVGQTIDWTNQDTAAHNVSYVSGPKFKSSGTLNTGSKFSLKLTQPGTIHYVCTIHPFMTATIVVSK
jgi:plastocyanin